jgi:hypothetical protein
MRISELDDIEKNALMGRRFRSNLRKEAQAINERNRVPGDPYYKEKSPRPGERIQKFWCEGCKDWHEGSVLGGPVGDPHGERTQR